MKNRFRGTCVGCAKSVAAHEGTFARTAAGLALWHPTCLDRFREAGAAARRAEKAYRSGRVVRGIR